MKKVIMSLLMIFMLSLSMFIGSVVASVSNSTNVSGFYRSDHTTGIAYSGPNYLRSHGYTPYVYSNASFTTFRTALQYSDLVFVNSHGDAGQVTLSSNNSGFSGTDIRTSSITPSARLVYLSTCYSANASSTYGNVSSEIYRKGVDVVVGFREAVTASTDTNGIHRFNMLFVYNFSDGYSVRQSLDLALDQLADETGSSETWGAGSYYIFGNYALTM